MEGESYALKDSSVLPGHKRMHKWKAQETRWEPRTHCRGGSRHPLAGRALVRNEVEAERKANASLLNTMFRSQSPSLEGRGGYEGL